MFKFCGDIEYICKNCEDSSTISIEDFNIDYIGGDERGMGMEKIYELTYQFNCDECNNEIILSFEASEYPLGMLNFVLNNSSGAETNGEPDIEYLREIYSAQDLFDCYESIQELMTALQWSPELLRDLTPREFEEVVAEIFISKGFKVELTKRTRDGGKDIIAISTDSLGIQNKYFIECKHYAEKNKIGVELVRTLHGVKNTKDGPNKTILVTTSSFTSGAKKFVKNETSSKWDMALKDYDDLLKWVEDYKK